jgi:hypothetical protein
MLIVNQSLKVVNNRKKEKKFEKGKILLFKKGKIFIDRFITKPEARFGYFKSKKIINSRPKQQIPNY